MLNLNNGSRLITYVIEAPAGSGMVMLNGPAARLGETGDIVVIISYAHCEDTAAREFHPKTVQVGSNNSPQ